MMTKFVFVTAMIVAGYAFALNTNMPDLSFPDTEHEYCENCGETDLVFDLKDAPEIQLPGISARIVGSQQFPVLKDTGVGMVRLNIEPCGVVPHHIHPRSYELLYVLKGEKVQIGTFDETRGLQEAIIGEDQFFNLPPAMIHYKANPSCEPVEIISSFSDDNIGTVLVPHTLLSMSAKPLAAAFGINTTRVRKLRFSLGTAGLDPICAARCGISA